MSNGSGTPSHQEHQLAQSRTATVRSLAPGVPEVDRAWMKEAACRGASLSEFFGKGASRQRGRARCQACPVAEICFWWAVVAEWEAGYHFGLWGGASPVIRAEVTEATTLGHARSRLAAALCDWVEGLDQSLVHEGQAG